MIIELGYGKGSAALEGDNLTVLLPNPVEHNGQSGSEIVRESLGNPIGAPPLSECGLAGKKIAIIASDITRPCPSYVILPELLGALNAAGADLGDITVVFALGSHRMHTAEEKRRLAGDYAFEHVNCVDSGERGFVRMGETSHGTPVDVCRTVAEADFRICTGNIEYHYFAGYSGGMKAIMPGVSTREAIRRNHSHMVEPGSAAGVLDGNPVREDIEEVANFCPAHYIVNVVLDEHKHILRCVSGHPVAAHRAGCRLLDGLYSVKIPKKYPIVIVSAGGYPKDINMYQAQKALDNASAAVEDGGVIIWLAECAEGLGEKTFETWMTTHSRSVDMISHIRSDFVLGGHKAAAIAMVLLRAEIILVSGLEPDFVRKIFMTPADSLTLALAIARGRLGDGAEALVIPYGGATKPVL